MTLFKFDLRYYIIDRIKLNSLTTLTRNLKVKSKRCNPNFKIKLYSEINQLQLSLQQIF